MNIKDEIYHNSVSGVTKFLHSGMNVNAMLNSGGTPLYTAYLYNRFEIFELLLSHPQIDVNCVDVDNFSLLFKLCHETRFDYVKLLLKNPTLKINYGGNDSDEWTPLMITCFQYGYHKNMSIDNIKMLLSHPDIDVNIQDGDGRTALSIACNGGHVNIVKLLINKSKINFDITNFKNDIEIYHLLKKKYNKNFNKVSQTLDIIQE
jgi:ankyrin repeat protein